MTDTYCDDCSTTHLVPKVRLCGLHSATGELRDAARSLAKANLSKVSPAGFQGWLIRCTMCNTWNPHHQEGHGDNCVVAALEAALAKAEPVKEGSTTDAW
jgi:hypothetical protein